MDARVAKPAKCSRTDPRVLRSVVDRRLNALLPPAGDAEELHRALRHAVLAPGKRLRPLLTVLATWELGHDDLRALDPGCALELVHAASLVLDDLPAMDDALLRRGRPTVHVAFGEDVALLAAITLLAQSFGVLSNCSHLDAKTRNRLVAILSGAVGLEGLAGGQFADLRKERARSASDLARLNHLKTGVLFTAAVEMGAAVSGVEDGRLAGLRAFATELGQAFQLLDDLLDVLQSSEATGKDTGQDRDKTTFVSLLGESAVQRRLEDHLRSALAALAEVSGGRGPLGAFVQTVFDGIREMVPPR